LWHKLLLYLLTPGGNATRSKSSGGAIDFGRARNQILISRFRYERAGLVAGKFIHLQEAVIAALLNFDQVRYLDGRRDLRKIESFTFGDFLLCHLPLLSRTLQVPTCL
jgi:hypothetical protein